MINKDNNRLLRGLIYLILLVTIGIFSEPYLDLVLNKYIMILGGCADVFFMFGTGDLQ